MYTHMLPSIPRVLKRVLYSLGLVLQAVVSYLAWMLGTELGSSVRAAKLFMYNILRFQTFHL